MNIMMGLEYELTMVRTFSNKAAALKYYKKSRQDVNRFEGLSEGSYQHFVISKTNYAIFYTDKLTADYLNYFNEKYLGAKTN
jgi:hypothetical protein